MRASNPEIPTAPTCRMSRSPALSPDPEYEAQFSPGTGRRFNLAYQEAISSPKPGDSSASGATSMPKMVFVGYGVQAPEYKWNDFKGVDVKGKVIVVLINDPPVKNSAGALDPKSLAARP